MLFLLPWELLPLKTAAEGYRWKVVAEALVPDEKAEIQRAIREQISKGCQLILATGGTGVALRDVTPEAVLETFIAISAPADVSVLI